MADTKPTTTFPVPTRGELTTVISRVPQKCVNCGKHALFFVTASRAGKIGYMCPECFAKFGVGIGYGYGQVIIDPDMQYAVSRSEALISDSTASYRIIFKRQS